MITPVASVAAMAPYALADLTPPDGARLISLAQNESLRGPSPAAIAAAATALSAPHLYPDPEWSALRDALAGLHGIDRDQILCGNGSMELIAALAHCFADAQTAVLAPRHAYPFFRTATALAQARFDTAPEDDTTVSIAALLDAVRPDTTIVFVANPGNPTGTRLSRTELLRLRDGLPPEVLLVIDEAYGEFADHLGEPVFDLVARGDTVVLRTFSKAYGLAGFRVGWGLFPRSLAPQMRKVMAPNNISVAGQAAATAAVGDQPYMRATCQITADRRAAFAARLRGAGLDVPDSFTNFLLIRFADAATARHVDQALRAGGVFLRPQGGAGLSHCLRATIGAEADMANVADRLIQLANEGYR